MKMNEPLIVGGIERVLAGALALADASLVIFRHGVLVEFKTELLKPALTATSEGGRRGWQVGPFDGHHCHLDLASVARIWFDAEPVSCQRGRLNYTVWFLGTRDCGNPYRADGLFSVTLNSPYRKDGSLRVDTVEPVYALHDAQRQLDCVSASETFIAARP